MPGMRHLWMVAALAALAGCKKSKKGGKPEPTTVMVTVDAAPVQTPAPTPSVDAGDGDAADDDADDDEAALRKGKPTGLGAPDELPEVATEDLIRALAAGKIAPARLIDPAAGIAETIIMPGGGDKPEPEIHRRRCGKQADKLLLQVAKAMARREADGKADGDHAIECSNSFLAAPDPDFGKWEIDDAKRARPARPLRHASCGASAAVEYDSIFDLILVPDGQGKLHVAAILEWESGMNPEGPYASLADDLAKPGCK